MSASSSSVTTPSVPARAGVSKDSKEAKDENKDISGHCDRFPHANSRLYIYDRKVPVKHLEHDAKSQEQNVLAQCHYCGKTDNPMRVIPLMFGVTFPIYRIGVMPIWTSRVKHVCVCADPGCIAKAQIQPCSSCGEKANMLFETIFEDGRTYYSWQKSCPVCIIFDSLRKQQVSQAGPVRPVRHPGRTAREQKAPVAEAKQPSVISPAKPDNKCHCIECHMPTRQYSEEYPGAGKNASTVWCSTCYNKFGKYFRCAKCHSSKMYQLVNRSGTSAIWCSGNERQAPHIICSLADEVVERMPDLEEQSSKVGFSIFAHQDMGDFQVCPEDSRKIMYPID